MSSSNLPAWGRKTGAVALTVASPAATVTELADRMEILDLVSRYAWSYDERDLTSLGSVFTEDAVWEGSIAGTVTIDALTGRDSVVDWLHGHMQAQSDQRRHNGLNPLVVACDGQKATVLAYLLLTSADGTNVVVKTTGFYRVSVAKQPDGRWLVEHIFAGFDAPF